MKKILSILLLIASVAAHSQNTGGVFVASKQQGFNNTLAATGQKILDGKAKYKDTINFTNRAFTSVAEANSYLPSVQRTVGQMMLINTGGSLSAGVITGGTNAWYYYKDGITNGDLVLMGAGNLQQVLTAGNQITAGTQMIKGTGPTVLQFDSLTNINWRHKGFFRLQADGGQQSAAFTQTAIILTAGDSVVIETPGQGLAVHTVSDFARKVQVRDTLYLPLIKTKTDTGAIKPTGVDADGNMFKMDRWPSSGGGATPTLPQVFAAGRTFSADDSMQLGDYSIYVKGKLKGDTVRLKVGDSLKPGLIITCIGNSVTAGSGASTPAKCYAALLAAHLQMSLNNQGYGGYTLGNPPGTGAPSFLSVYTSAIPTKDASHAYLTFCWGVNEAMYAAQYCCPPGGPLDYSTARFKAAYRTIIDYAIAHGTGADVWSNKNMIILSPVWQEGVNPVFQDSFFVASREIAIEYGILFIDLYHATKNSSPADKVDYVHPSDWGHAYLMQLTARQLDSINYVRINPLRLQTLAVNGWSAFDKVQILNPDTAKVGALVATINPGGDIAAAPMDKFMLFQNDLGHYRQPGNFWGLGNLNVGGNVVSGGSGWFGGPPSGIGTNVGALLCLNSGMVYLSGWNGGVALDCEISNGGQTTGIGGGINSTRPTISAGSKNQFRGGSYMDEWAIIDSSGNRHAFRPHTITTDGDTVTYTDRHGVPHDFAFVDRITPGGGGGIDHIAPTDSMARSTNPANIVSGHILHFQTTDATHAGFMAPGDKAFLDSFKLGLRRDTLNLTQIGTPGVNDLYSTASGMRSAFHKGTGSVVTEADTDSTVLYHLQNDTTFAAPAGDYYYKTNSITGRKEWQKGPTSGTYVPTLTNTANISTSVYLTATWTRVGNNVHVTIGGEITPTTLNTTTTMTLSLPFTTATTTQAGAGSGTLRENGGGRPFAGVYVSIASGTTATATMWATIATTGSYSLSFDYTL